MILWLLIAAVFAASLNNVIINAVAPVKRVRPIPTGSAVLMLLLALGQIALWVLYAIEVGDWRIGLLVAGPVAAALIGSAAKA